MGILLGLGDVELVPAALAHHLGEAVADVLRRVGDPHRQPALVLGHGDVGQIVGDAAPLELREVLVEEGVGQLARPVGPEVEEDHGVPIDDPHRLLPLGADADRRQELVGDPDLVLRADVGDGIGRACLAGAGDDLVGPLDAVPALVTIHGVVAAGHRDDPAHPDAPEVGDELLHEAGTAVGQLVTAVREGVDVDAVQAPALGQLADGDGVVLVAMDAARRDQAEEVKAGAPGASGIDRLDQGRVLQEAAIGNRAIDPGERLVDHPADADGQVTHLGVSLLAGRQAHRLAAGGGQGVGRGRPHLVPVRGPGGRDGVAELVGGVPPAVDDDQDEGTWPGRHRCSAAAAATSAARTMAVKASTLRLAPPTRAPWMCGWPKSSAALSAVTLPP